MCRKFDLSFVNTGAGNVAFLPVLIVKLFKFLAHVILTTP